MSRSAQPIYAKNREAPRFGRGGGGRGMGRLSPGAQTAISWNTAPVPDLIRWRQP
jgi:hypothetical protein